MNMIGKAYANRKKREKRPKGDFYATPKSLVWEISHYIKNEFIDKTILDPACGNYAISDELKKMGYIVEVDDLYTIPGGMDYLTAWQYTDTHQVITNPPFSLWDDFVKTAKLHCTKFMFIGRLNYFGTNDRYKSGLWKNLKFVLPFNRYVDYQTPQRDDGLFHVGALATAWFVWDMKYYGKPIIDIIDVQKYAKLGAFK